MEKLIVDNFSEINIGFDIFEKDKNGRNTNKLDDTTSNCDTDSRSDNTGSCYNDGHNGAVEEKEQQDTNNSVGDEEYVEIGF